ncbi:hypothetical protein FOA52_007910 [Chlamydomonas sp. UWO 241]|nr:hypothetical protein FOA52_007910 [Chlamydomonas sp. UWO 241]
MSIPVLVLGAAVCTLITVVVMRHLSHTLLLGNRPPVFEGIPLIGGLLKFIKGPMSLMTEGYATLGDVFTVPVLHKRITFLIGPHAAPHFFKATDEEMSQTEVYNFNVPTFGPGVIYDVDQKVRTEQFRFFTEALKKDRLKKYVPLFVMEAEMYFKNWGQTGVVDFKDVFSELITLTAARTLLGREVREQMFEKVAALLHDLDAGMIPISTLLPYLPIPVHNTRDRAREEMRRIFQKVVTARRASGVKEEDVLQQFIDARYQNVNGGRATNDSEICGMLIASLFAGQHTSSITTAWTGIFMTADKAISWDPACAEQKAIIKTHGAEITYDALQDMEVLQRNITEALRMHPPLVLVLRYAKSPFEVTTRSGKKYTVPKGDVVAASPNFNHTLEHVFTDAHKYDPARFAPPREEDKRTPLGFIGFGGGRHGCIGSNFAYLQIKTIWSVLMRNFEFELLDPVPEPDYNSMVIGPKACRVRYTRRKATL